MSGKSKDLLSTSLCFRKLTDQKSRGAFQVIEEVSAGRITKVNDHLNSMSKDDKSIEVTRLVNSMDAEGKTPLFYACYYNFQNLVLFLLMKGADSSITASNGQNVVHLCCFMGHLECLSLILNFERHKDRMKLFADVKQEMKNFYFKRTDVRSGVLVSPDKHNPTVQERFTAFRQSVSQVFRNFLNTLGNRLTEYISPPDEIQRNPLHYASLNKFTKCHKTARFVMEYGLEITGYQDFEDLFNEVTLLELNKEVRIDPRQYLLSVQSNKKPLQIHNMIVYIILSKQSSRLFEENLNKTNKNQINKQSICFCHFARNFLPKVVQNFLLPSEYATLTKAFKSEIRKTTKTAVNAQDNEGYSPLHLASFYGDFASVQFFLKQGADPKAVDSKQRKEVLDFASSDQVRKYLIDLKDAARKGDDKSFNFLVNCGHAVNGKKTIFGIAPIHNAIQNVNITKDDTILRSVVKCDADINIPDSNGWTSLHHACKNGDLPTVQYLIQESADIHRFSSKGYQPIHIAAMFNFPQVIQFLLESEANVESLTVQKLTPLHLAAKKGNVESMKVLLDNKANIYAVDERKWTSLHFAAFYYHKDAVQMLQRYDADYEKLKFMMNSQGKTAKQTVTNEETRFALFTLWNASREGNLDIVRRLTTLGNEINEQTFYNKTTPLMFAVQNQHYLIVKFLLENGADSSVTDQANKNALDYAYAVNNRKIIGLLDATLQ